MPDEDGWIDVTPDSALIDAFRAEKEQYHALIAEAVDNSFDAAARNIDIVLNSQLVFVKDDGVGVTKDRQKALFTLGSHARMDSTVIGRYGIGLTRNAIGAGDILEVRSTSLDGTMEAGIDWSAVRENGWKDQVRPRWSKPRGDPTGTEIRISKLRWNLTKKVIDGIPLYLAQLFYPAIDSGRTICFNGELIPLLQEPELKGTVVDCVIKFSGGRSAIVRGGILASLPSKLCSVYISYRHRVIIAESTIGCGGRSGIRLMFARVRLEGNWLLTPLKDGIEGHQYDELNEALRDALSKVFDECEDEHLTLRIMEYEFKINTLIREDLRPARPPRDKTKRPKKKKRKRKRRSRRGITDGPESESGPARKSMAKGLEIKFSKNLFESYGIGKFTLGDHGTPSVIQLSVDCPRIKQLLDTRYTEASARSLYELAIGIYLNEKDFKRDQPGQQFMTDIIEPYGLKFWKLICHQFEKTIIDDKERFHVGA